MGSSVEEHYMTRPSIVNDEMLVFLDELRESGVTNMFGAGPYVAEAFDLGAADAREVTSYWMESFGDDER